MDLTKLINNCTQKEPTECQGLAYLNRTVHADSEDDLDFLFDILSPTFDREDMGEKYKTAIGYNPLDFFDEHYLRGLYDDLVEDTTGAAHDALIAKEDSIIHEALDRRDEIQEDHLSGILTSIISREIGIDCILNDAKPLDFVDEELEEESEEESDDDEDDLSYLDAD